MEQQNTDVNLPLFFIIGRARSGTTLLRTMLDAHPNVVIPVECAFVQHLYSKYGGTKYWSETTISNFRKDLENEPAYKLMNIDEARLKKNLYINAIGNSYANACRIVYESCLSFYEKEEIKLLGDKNPSYSLFTETLLKIFPEAKFIHIIRDYRDNIVSMRRVDFEAPIVSSLAYRWKYYNIQIEKAKAKHPDKFYSVRYEDLVTHTPKYLREICSFLDIPYDEKMLTYQEKKDAYYANYPKDVLEKYHKSLFEPVDSTKSGTWENKLSKKQIKIAEAVAGNYGEKYGYKKTLNKPNFIFYLSVIPGIIYGRLYFTWGAFINLMPYKTKMGIIFFFAFLFKPYWKRYEKKGK